MLHCCRSIHIPTGGSHTASGTAADALSPASRSDDDRLLNDQKTYPSHCSKVEQQKGRCKGGHDSHRSTTARGAYG